MGRSVAGFRRSVSAAVGCVPGGLRKPLRRIAHYVVSLPKGSRAALAVLRRLTLRRTTIIAVTGSVGKTTTTTLIGAVLSKSGTCTTAVGRNRVRHSVNALLALKRSTEYSVHEAATNKPGIIAQHVRILRPRIGVVTTIGNDHYRSFRSLEVTAKEKGQLIKALPRSGKAVLNADDPYVIGMASFTKARVITYGISANADLRASEIAGAWPDPLSFTVAYGNEEARVQTQLFGKQWVIPVLAALACGLACKIDLRTCVAAIGTVEAVFARYSVHRAAGGPTYVLASRKAPYWILASMFTFMREARAPRKTIVLGTISDHPGGVTNARYRRLARQALEVADRVMFVGPQAGSVEKLRCEEELSTRLFAFQTSYQACKFLALDRLDDELIFVHASITDHLERIMLSQLDQVVCWRERCRKRKDCPNCSNYRKPHAPPFGVRDIDVGAATQGLTRTLRTAAVHSAYD